MSEVERRTPPHSIEAEMGTLGSILLDNNAIDLVSEIVTADDFYSPANQRLFAAMLALSKRKSPIDPITLRDYLKSVGQYDECGGSAWIERLLDEVHSAANAESYARIVAEKSRLRKVLLLTFETQGAVYDNDEQKPAADIASAAAVALSRIGEQSTKAQPIILREALYEAAAWVDERMEKPDQTPGLSTGLPDVDRKIGGLQSAMTYLVAGRASMGKSALALNAALSAAEDAYRQQTGTGLVYYASLEMPARQLALRARCSLARVSLEKARRGVLDGEEFGKLARADERMAPWPLIFDCDFTQTIGKLAARIRRAVVKHGFPALLVIDYLQKLRPENARKNQNREQDVSEMSAGTKLLAGEFSCPVIVVSQINRESEKGADKRPTLAGLRESGAIEQDADVVLLLFREGYYRPEMVTVGSPQDAEINIAKNRDGETGTVKVLWEPRWTRFESAYNDTPPQECEDSYP